MNRRMELREQREDSKGFSEENVSVDGDTDGEGIVYLKGCTEEVPSSILSGR